MQKFVIIMAGGAGIRMGGETPKQFLLLNGKPVIMHAIERFLEYDDKINPVIVLPEASIDHWESLCKEHNFTYNHTITSGGDERFYSVKNGLRLTAPDSLIAVHDAVRPLVSLSTIRACFEEAEKTGCAIPVITTPESVREVDIASNQAGLSTGIVLNLYKHPRFLAMRSCTKHTIVAIHHILPTMQQWLKDWE